MQSHAAAFQIEQQAAVEHLLRLQWKAVQEAVHGGEVAAWHVAQVALAGFFEERGHRQVVAAEAAVAAGVLVVREVDFGERARQIFFDVRAASGLRARHALRLRSCESS